MVRYSIIGLGKLGASIAAALASRGHQVIGVDLNGEAIDAINGGKAPVYEPGLADLISKNRDRLRATCDYHEAILESDITFIIVPTPSDNQGGFSLEFVGRACEKIGQALREKLDYHVIGLISTVLPGSTRNVVMPILEAASGKECGTTFGLCYCPVFVALGSAINDFLRPDFTLIGEFDEHAGSILEKAFSTFSLERVPSLRMSVENAELVKISINAYVTMKITFANTLADLCARIPGGLIDVVTNAVGHDKRIGSKYLTGSIGYGGPCFPRDNLALAYLARELGTRAELAETTDRVNRSLISEVLERINLSHTSGKTIAVLGLAYKPLSNVIEESQGLILAKTLASRGHTVVAHDPLAWQFPKEELSLLPIAVKPLEDCLKQASIVIVATADPIYSELQPKDFIASGKPVIVVDCWRVLMAKLRDANGIRYIPIGVSVNDETNQKRLARLWEVQTDDARAELKASTDSVSSFSPSERR